MGRWRWLTGIPERYEPPEPVPGDPAIRYGHCDWTDEEPLTGTGDSGPAWAIVDTDELPTIPGQRDADR